jgi:DNA-binding MarR family transcriptional regulator
MSPHPPEDAVVEAVLTASRTLVAVAEQSLGAAAEETTLAHYRALVVLASRGPQRMVDLARALHVTPPTAGRMCDRLVRRGLIRISRRETPRCVTQQNAARARQARAESCAGLGHVTSVDTEEMYPCGRDTDRARGRGERLDR